jgi:hypothetical protein
VNISLKNLDFLRSTTKIPAEINIKTQPIIMSVLKLIEMCNRLRRSPNIGAPKEAFGFSIEMELALNTSWIALIVVDTTITK